MQEAVAAVIGTAAIGAFRCRSLPVGGADQGVDQSVHGHAYKADPVRMEPPGRGKMPAGPWAGVSGTAPVPAGRWGWHPGARPPHAAACPSPRLVLALLLPALLAARPAATQGLAGHGGPVRALVVSADGAGLASGGFDRSVILWDPAGGPGAAGDALACRRGGRPGPAAGWWLGQRRGGWADRALAAGRRGGTLPGAGGPYRPPSRRCWREGMGCWPPPAGMPPSASGHRMGQRGCWRAMPGR
ncbi:hypothetical protein [Siccirubricoccus sp. G192]|uniref:WD40 repeat domain-containing protein n=1 Tax=Siccirubricoccus sp. G192 TaxID=2849651 RepID=UPI0035C86574